MLGTIGDYFNLQTLGKKFPPPHYKVHWAQHSGVYMRVCDYLRAAFEALCHLVTCNFTETGV